MRIMNQPLVSVIVAIYNVSQYLEKCIESILNQTEGNTEVILVDDGSTDGSAEICDHYAKKDSRVRVIHQTNVGVSSARNAGIDTASAKWIAFVDGDDFLDPHFVEKMYEAVLDEDKAENEETDIVCCSYYSFQNGESVSQTFFPIEFCYKSMEDKIPLFYQLMDSHCGQAKPYGATAIGVPWAKLYRSSLIQNQRFDLELRRMQDNVFNMYAFSLANEIKYILNPLYYYRVDHIRGYKSVGYPPDVYATVLKHRETFYGGSSLFLSEAFVSHRNNEKFEYLYRSCRNIVVTSSDYREARCRLNDLRQMGVYEKVMPYRKEARRFTRRLVVSLLYRCHYRIMYMVIELYWKVRTCLIKKLKLG